MSFLQGFFKSAMGVASRTYRGMVGKRLRAAGLKYHDLLIETSDVNVALSRTSAQIRLERDRRIKRAFDASLKKKVMPQEVQESYNPFDLYLQKKMKVAEFERIEKVLMDA